MGSDSATHVMRVDSFSHSFASRSWVLNSATVRYDSSLRRLKSHAPNKTFLYFSFDHQKKLALERTTTLSHNRSLKTSRVFFGPISRRSLLERTTTLSHNR